MTSLSYTYLKNNKFYLSLLFFSILILALSPDTFASGSDIGDPLGTTLCRIIKVVLGPTAKVIAMFAIFFVAVGLFAGRMTWLGAAPVIIGIIIIFSAPAMVSFISGSDMGECTATGT